MAVRVAVITVTWNSGRVLPEFLASLSAQAGVEWQLYVVENASTDDTLAQLTAFAGQHAGRVTVLTNARNEGAAAGNNRGIEQAMADGHELLLLINNDVVFGAELTAKLCQAMAEHGCALAAPRMVYADRPGTLWFAGGEFQRWAGYRTVHFGQGRPDAAEHGRSRRVTYAPTTCLLVARQVFARVGLLDAAYFAYSEDADLLFRANAAGFATWYEAEVCLQHKVSSLIGHESAFSDRYGTRNRVYFLRKNAGTLPAALWSSVYLGYCVLRWLVRKDSSVRLRRKAAAWVEGWQIPMEARPGT